MGWSHRSSKGERLDQSSRPFRLPAIPDDGNSPQRECTRPIWNVLRGNLWFPGFGGALVANEPEVCSACGCRSLPHTTSGQSLRPVLILGRREVENQRDIMGGVNGESQRNVEAGTCSLCP